MKKTLFCFLCIFVMFSACKSPPGAPEIPPPLPEPSSRLTFQGVEAETPDLLDLNFLLEMGNPYPAACGVRIESWQTEINGQKVNSGFELDSTGTGENVFSLNASGIFPLKLYMDVPVLIAEGHAPSDDYEVSLILNLVYSWNNEAGQGGEVIPDIRQVISGLAIFPGVRAPEFSITSIAILKAELVNTRFRVGLKIDNPNPFPVELSEFGYELHGNGRLWADGVERNIIRVASKSSLQGNLFLTMNFINMRRDLLDQIIRLEDVNYRFAGEANVSTGVEYLPRFSTDFDLSGYSRVYDN